MKPEQCYKFKKCSAGICPLELSVGSHLIGEPVCRAATEMVKKNGLAVVGAHFGQELADTLQQSLVQLKAYDGDIARRLNKASHTGSKYRTLPGTPKPRVATNTTPETGKD